MAHKILVKRYSWPIALFVIASCTQKQDIHNNLSAKKDTLVPPVTYTVDSPYITLLDTCPPPQVINVPQKTGGHYILKTENGPKTIQLLPPSNKPADFFVSMQNYNVEDGLALSSVSSSCCDKNGNLWFGTSGGGVSRYDGKSFTNYTMAQGLMNNQVFCAYEDKSGNMWFGTWNGVSKYNGIFFKNYYPANGLLVGKVQAILQDKKGDIWFADRYNGTSRYDGKSFINYDTKDGLISSNVTSLLEDNKGNMWFGTNLGVSRYDGKAFVNYTISQGLINNQVETMLQDNNGNIWFGTSEGVSEYDGKTFKNFTTALGLVNNSIASLFEDKNNHIWIGTEGGVSEYDGKSFKNFTTANGLSGNNVSSTVEDKNGNIWFSSWENGISEYPGQAFTTFTKNQGLSSNLILSICAGKNGNLWFGTGDGGALEYDGSSFTNYTTAQGLGGNRIYCIFEDKNENFWFANNNGVSCYDGKSFATYTTAQGLPTNIVWSIAQDKKGNLWFGTFGGGLCKLDVDRKYFVTYTSPDTLTNNNIHKVYVTEAGNLWLGIDDGGVTSYDGKSFKNYSTNQGVANATIMNILEDSNHNMWFATAGGISRYDGKTFRNYYHDQGLANDEVMNSVEDKKGVLWFGTQLGFSGLKFKTKNQDSIKKREDNFVNAGIPLSNTDIETNYEPVFENYNFKNGYPVKDLAFPNAMYIDPDNILWAGTGDKLVRFDYSRLHKNDNTPNAFIQGIKLNNENICWYDIKKDKEKIDSGTISSNVAEEVNFYGKELTQLQRDSVIQKLDGIKFDSITSFYEVPVNLVLPYQFNNITIDFAAIEPSKPKLVRYQYILEGYDKELNPITDKPSASFGNIHEGAYTFKLKALSPDGIWSNPITYSFKVLPPWYRTWLAYALYIVAFLIALWSFVEWRQKALKKEKISLEEKVAVRTHELKEEKQKVETALSDLKSTQAQLIQSEKMASLGELTAGIAHEIQNPLNFVNNFSEVNTELIDELKNELARLGSFGAIGNTQSANEIADDIKDNEQKINHHGKRADAIVKGMLQHSRISSGQKEPTDINALADEYLRLSYHGLRAKDKSFSATIKTDYDKPMGKISVIPQDIGRVILNLINNAFYAVDEKKKSPHSLKGGEEYEPVVTVSTKRIGSPSVDGSKVEIKVSDNGNGIPQNIVDKIFQPFFTTKPAGQGTGLGLSLAYDIVKAHGGEIKVETKEGEGSEFIIQLPV